MVAAIWYPLGVVTDELVEGQGGGHKGVCVCTSVCVCVCMCVIVYVCVCGGGVHWVCTRVRFRFVSLKHNLL